MADYSPENSTEADKPDDAGSPKAQARFRQYQGEIARYNRAAEKWHSEGEKIEKMFAEEDRAEDSTRRQGRRYALLWSNIETLQPAVYAKCPNVVASRRFKDSDPTGRVGAELLERCANTTFDLYDLDDVLQNVRDDLLKVGRGSPWCRYEADFEEKPDIDPVTKQPVMDEEGKPKTRRVVTGERACVDHVDWTDLGHNVCRKWQEVWLVWRNVYKTKAEATERFGKEIADKLTYDQRSPEVVTDSPSGTTEQSEHTAKIREVWDKRRKRVCFIAAGYDGLIDDGEPPLDLHNFFPCPRPAYGVRKKRSLIPRPDYVFYRDQAEQIDELTIKIGNLTDWLALKGFIPGGPSSEGSDAIEEALSNSENTQVFIRVESWSQFKAAGGADLVEWLPLDMVITALKAATETRRMLIEDVYQITGISDILRGMTDPDETLGAQEIKSQTGSRRVKHKKDQMARVARDTARIVCEIIGEYFSPETISAMSGYHYQPQMDPAAQQGQQQQANQGAGQGSAQTLVFDDKIMSRLRDDLLRTYSIDIETDSTVQPDEDAEKQRRTEFATMFGTMLEQATGLTQLGPIAAPLVPMVGEAIKFTVRGFRTGRQLEDAIDRAMDQVSQMITQMQSQPQPPSPEEIKAQAMQQKAQLDQQLAEQKMAHEQQRMQMEERMQQQTLMFEKQMGEMKVQLAQILAGIKLQQGRQQLQITQEQGELERQQAHEQHELDSQARHEEAEFAHQDRQDQAAFDERKRAQQLARPNGNGEART